MAVNFKVKVKKVNGFCDYGFKEGQEIELNGLHTPKGGFCGGAYHALFPYLNMLNFGGKFPSIDIINATCADGGKVMFEIKVQPDEEDVNIMSAEKRNNELDVYAEIKNTLIKIGIDEENIKPEAILSTDIDMDSTEVVELIIYIEKKFGLSFESCVLKDYTLNKLSEEIYSRLGA
ncbi:TIGR04076 family protein [Clostridium beijerinckii]|uniref:Acyl carrier protein n=1 Tax=Clostridium beijerinckii TaxID=1520 RepID=A0A1S8SK12_CLOBE|nr:TIGR04076 family protein [Clostridium beijerinckii]NRY61545.1 putative repeat protein (TIGR04076 family) [Clostridium beijerinckii]OOM65860.1 acyl carrier protein [Clostridium beijerinckii]